MAKAKGPHVEKRLTPALVKKAPPGRHTDGGGLYLVVAPSGARRWVARITLNGERRDFGLGPVNTVSLAEARERAAEYRRAAFLGLDPRLDRVKAAGSISFKDAAAKAHEELVLSHGRNGKHKKQWITTLETYAFPFIGNMDIAEIQSGDIVRVLRPIWSEKHVTATRVKQRIGSVIDWAIVNNYRSKDNPTNSVLKGLTRVKAEPKHFAAVKHQKARDVWCALREKAENAKRKDLVGITALQFAILNATRSKPVRFATWSQMQASQEDYAVFPHWLIPADTMKAGKGFIVPLSKPAQELLARWREIAPKSELIFPSPYNPNKPISDATMRKVLQEQVPGMTVHGWRSTFTDWVAETTDFPPYLTSAALAHGRDKTDAAYRRTQYFEKRYPMMEAWGRYLEHGNHYTVTLHELEAEKSQWTKEAIERFAEGYDFDQADEKWE